MLRPKLLYFLYYAAMASLLPFLVLYYAQLGFTGRQIGVLSALLPVMTLLGVPLWSAAADASGRYRAIILLSVGTALVCTLAASSVTSYLGLLGVVGALSFCVAPIMPLTDTAVLTLLQNERHRYGNLRLWGAVGWGVGAPLTGWLVGRGQRLGEGVGELRWAFWVAAALLGSLWAVGYTLPRLEPTPPQKSRTVRGLVSPVWLGFLLIGLTGGVCLAVSSNFLYLHMTALGMRASFVGLALTAATLSEVPVFFFSGRLLRRYSARTLLLSALTVFAARLFLYSVFAAPWPILALQLLHGPSFSLLWAAGVAYADQHAPEGFRATAQGFFSAALLGWGGVVGALIGGTLYDAYGAAVMFRWVAAGTAAVCLGVSVWGVYGRKTRNLQKGPL